MNLKEIVKQSPVASYLRVVKDRLGSLAWFLKGRIGPAPHFIKQATVLAYARTYGCECFVETGTFLGDMLFAMTSHFTRLYSIELDLILHKKAQTRFAQQQNVTLIQGDSGVALLELLPRVPRKTIFWLDGHYSGGITAKAEIDTPIMQELRGMETCEFKDFVILIDDARMFVGRDGYPTLDELRAYVAQLGTHVFEVQDDIIRLTPQL
jgi:hypothetical protein